MYNRFKRYESERYIKVARVQLKINRMFKKLEK